jgi:hypothetical protein
LWRYAKQETPLKIEIFRALVRRYSKMKDVEIPQNTQRVMAMEAEAMREKRARIIKADDELEASQKLADAAQLMVGNPAVLELRSYADGR